MQERQLVEHVGQPLRLGLPVQVQSPQGILQRFCTHGDFRCQRLFRQVLEGTADLEIFREVVLPVDTEHALALHAVLGIAL